MLATDIDRELLDLQSGHTTAETSDHTLRDRRRINISELISIVCIHSQVLNAIRNLIETNLDSLAVAVNYEGLKWG